MQVGDLLSKLANCHTLLGEEDETARRLELHSQQARVSDCIKMQPRYAYNYVGITSFP